MKIILSTPPHMSTVLLITSFNKFPTAVNKHELQWGILNVKTKQTRLETDLNIVCYTTKPVTAAKPL
jgi:hypothetical protein